MHVTSPPPPLLETLGALVRAADAPAREAIRLSRAPLLYTVARGTIGALALAASMLALATLREEPRRAVDALALVAEALGTVAPLTLIAALWSSIATPRTVLAALSLGLLTGGWVALGMVPLAAFTALVAPPAAVSGAGLAALDAFALMMVVTTLGSVALVLRRVLLAVERAPAAHVVSTLFAAATAVVFVLRARPWLGRVVQELRVW